MNRSLNFYFPSIERGGLEKNVFSLVNSLAEKNYKINFFTYQDNTNNKEFNRKFIFHKNIKVITANFIPGIKLLEPMHLRDQIILELHWQCVRILI